MDINTVKTVSSIVVQLSVSSAVGTAVQAFCPAQNTTQKVKFFVAGAVLGSMVADHASTYTVDKIDEIKSWFDKKNHETNHR